MKNILPSLLCSAVLLLNACGDKAASQNDISPGPVIKGIATAFKGKVVCDKAVIVEGMNFSPVLTENEILLGVGMDIDVIRPIEASTDRLVFEAPEITGPSIMMRVVSKGKESSSYTLQYDQVRCDSVILCRKAIVTQLRPGVKWFNIYDIWEGAIRSVNIVEIELSNLNRIAIACPETNTRTSAQCLKHGAFLGVNGSYFSHTYVKVDGKVIQPGRDQGVNVFMHDGVFTIDDNVPGIAYVGSNERASTLSNHNVMCCGPLLINHNEHRLMTSDSHNTTTHPRTGVAITEEGKVLLATVDGRFTDKAVGMPTPLFARLLDAFGAEYALNLDGGGSTTLWIEGRGIVNHPCDERQWDNPVEREIGSIVYLK